MTKIQRLVSFKILMNLYLKLNKGRDAALAPVVGSKSRVCSMYLVQMKFCLELHRPSFISIDLFLERTSLGPTHLWHDLFLNRPIFIST